MTYIGAITLEFLDGQKVQIPWTLEKNGEPPRYYKYHTQWLRKPCLAANVFQGNAIPEDWKVYEDYGLGLEEVQAVVKVQRFEKVQDRELCGNRFVVYRELKENA